MLRDDASDVEARWMRWRAREQAKADARGDRVGQRWKCAKKEWYQEQFDAAQKGMNLDQEPEAVDAKKEFLPEFDQSRRRRRAERAPNSHKEREGTFWYLGRLPGLPPLPSHRPLLASATWCLVFDHYVIVTRGCQGRGLQTPEFPQIFLLKTIRSSRYGV